MLLSTYCMVDEGMEENGRYLNQSKFHTENDLIQHATTNFLTSGQGFKLQI